MHVHSFLCVCASGYRRVQVHASGYTYMYVYAYVGTCTRFVYAHACVCMCIFILYLCAIGFMLLWVWMNRNAHLYWFSLQKCKCTALCARAFTCMKGNIQGVNEIHWYLNATCCSGQPQTIPIWFSDCKWRLAVYMYVATHAPTPIYFISHSLCMCPWILENVSACTRLWMCTHM